MNYFNISIDIFSYILDILIVTLPLQNLHNENSYNQLLADTKTNSVEHGYGLLNIKDIVNKYHGFQTYSFNDNFVYNIMIPYIDKSFIS